MRQTLRVEPAVESGKSIHCARERAATGVATTGLLDGTRVARIERRLIGAEKGFLSATARVMIEYDADFRLAALYCLFIPVKGFYLAGAEPGTGTGRLLDAMAERFYASALELDAGHLLD